MLTVLVILAVLGILFGAAVLATYEGDVLRDSHPDDRADALPPGHLQPEDVAELRFDMALRGYRMSEVDDAMARLGAELADREARIAQLEQALVDVVEPAEQTVASVQVDIADAAVEQTQEQEPEPAAEPEPASAPVDLPPAADEQTQELMSLTLSAGDEAFSFPELHLPEPAAEPEAPEEPLDWWRREPPDD